MRGRKQTPMDPGAGPYAETYATEKRRRLWNLGMVHTRREIANLLAGISALEWRELKAGDVAGRIIDRLCELGAVNLYAAGTDYQNAENVRDIEDRRGERLKVAPIDHGFDLGAGNPYAKPRR
jgi:hypothetical protein